LVRLEDEEAFTALLQNLDEDKKRLLDQFIQDTKDHGLIEALLLSFEEAIHFIEDPGLQDTYKWDVKRCFKGISPVYVDYAPDEPRLTLTQFLKIISMLLLVHNPEAQTTQPQQQVTRENQRAHEPLNQTFKRLHRKYGRDQFMITAHQVDEEANGIQHQAMAKNVPVKYMTIGQAAEEFQIANATLVEWVADGWLQNVTKVQHPAKPESGIVLVEPREVAKLKEKVGIGEEAAEPTLITLVDAAKKYDVPYWTVRAWYHRGHLSEKGREVFGTHGGGKILVDENEVIRLMNRRTPKRKSPSKPAE
jgi:hypothetical protein